MLRRDASVLAAIEDINAVQHFRRYMMRFESMEMSFSDAFF